MRLALALGRRGQGRVWPNPSVGCIIVNDGRIVGRGRTADGGRPHGETVALEQAGKAAQGATAYVTLEPCAHFGKTPPCASALVSAGIARVVVAAIDPNPLVSGKGIELLRAAGITVETGLLADAAEKDLSGFLSGQTRHVPFVTLKLAMTLDGRIATKDGESKWITGPEARRKVHAMRATHDAVMVGGGTVRADDPNLDIRDLGIDRQPVRVVLSAGLNLPLESKLAKSASIQPLWICHGQEAAPDKISAWQSVGAKTICCATEGPTLDMASVLRTLAAEGLTRVFCEGGGEVAASLLTADLVDELVVFGAGAAIGADGRPGIAKMGVSSLSQAPRLRLTSVERVGADIMSRWGRQRQSQ